MDVTVVVVAPVVTGVVVGQSSIYVIISPVC